ncbi:unnamed protein product, partial [Meganyctiphanes norvegica]
QIMAISFGLAYGVKTLYDHIVEEKPQATTAVNDIQTLQPISLPQGKPTVEEDWICLFALENSRAEFQREIRFKIGKTKTQSNMQSISGELGVKASAGVDIYGIGKSEIEAALKVSGQLEWTSSDIWNEETERKDTITVKQGESIAVWQKIYKISYGDQQGAIHVEIFAHTTSPKIKPTAA